MVLTCGQTPRQMCDEVVVQHMKSKPDECWVHEPLPEEDLPLKWSQAAPCIGKRVVTLHITASSATELKLIWSGNTWDPLFHTKNVIHGRTRKTHQHEAFREKMDEVGIKGQL